MPLNILSIVMILLGALTVLLALLIGFILGKESAALTASLKRLTTRVSQLQDETQESAVIVTTPQLIREKVRKGQTPDTESAIVTVKTPQELRQAQDAKLKEELDRLSS